MQNCVLTLFCPQPLIIAGIFPHSGSSLIGNGIAWTESVNLILSFVRNTAISFAITCWLNFGWFTILSNAYRVSACERNKMSATTSTFDGFDRFPCVHWAAVNMKRGLMITPPHTWILPCWIETWYGNWPNAAPVPPIIRSLAKAPATNTTKHVKVNILTTITNSSNGWTSC